MSLVTYLVRGELRRCWRLWFGVMALIAVGGGTSMFAISAWQRTATAMDRFLLGPALAAVPVVLVAALAVALGPALTSARTPPSTILRAE